MNCELRITNEGLVSAPLRIACRPELVRVGGSGRPIWVYTCVVGVDEQGQPVLRIFRGPELEALLGLYHGAMRIRVRKIGWQSPLIMLSGVAYAEKKKEDTRRRQAADPLEALGGNEEWKGLGGRDRKRNLARIRPAGTWERQEVDHV